MFELIDGSGGYLCNCTFKKTKRTRSRKYLTAYTINCKYICVTYTMRGGLFLFLVSFIPAHRSMTFRSSPACSLMFRPAFHAHLRGWEVYRCKCTYTKYEKCTCMQQNSVVAWTPNLQVQSCQGPQQSTTRSSWQDVPFLIPLALRLRDLIKDARRVREYAKC